MSIWDKIRPRKPDDTGEDRAEAELVNWLEQMQFQARPEFENSLKNRLQASLLAQPPAPVRPTRWQGFSMAWRKPLPVALGLGGLAAITIVLVSVLSLAGSPVGDSNPTTSGLVGAATPEDVPTVAENGTVTALVGAVTPVTTGANPGAVGGINLLYNTTTQQYIAPDEASKALGFPVRGPAYLPPNYQLQYAALQVPPEKNGLNNSLDAKGYQLRYLASSADKNSKATKNPEEELEVYEWRVPFDLKPGNFNFPLGPANRPGPPAAHFPNIMGAQRSSPQQVQGNPGYLIEGTRWHMSVLSPGEIPAAGFNGSAPANVTPGSGPPPRPAAADLRYRLASRVSFGRAMPGMPVYSIDFSRFEAGKSRADLKDAKALIWQQGSNLSLVVGPNSLSDQELVRVAEGLKIVSNSNN
jgi:hypothetical protein